MIKLNEFLNLEPNCMCKCGYEFCFDCGEISHDPISCDLLKKWMLMGNEETNSYLSKYTKVCPHCGILIEKFGGTNIIVN